MRTTGFGHASASMQSERDRRAVLTDGLISEKSLIGGESLSSTGGTVVQAPGELFERGVDAGLDAS